MNKVHGGRDRTSYCMLNNGWHEILEVAPLSYHSDDQNFTSNSISWQILDRCAVHGAIVISLYAWEDTDENE